MATEMNNFNFEFSKPLYVGTNNMILSEMVMYEFDYIYILRKFTNSKLLYMENDCLIIKVQNQILRTNPYI